MPIGLILLFGLCMFMNAVVFSMLGQGGGVLYTPIQLAFGIKFQTAAATSLILIMVSSFSSTMVFKKAHKVDWGMGLSLESSSMAGAFVGGWLSRFVPEAGLFAIFALVIAVAAVFMVRDFKQPVRCTDGPSTLFSWKRRLGDESYCVNLPLGLPIAMAAGVASGMMGIAGGLLKVPMMALLFGVPIEIAVASSSFMVGLTAMGGFLGHLAAGQVDWMTAGLLAPLVFIGARIGASQTLAVNEHKLKKGFGWFLILMAIGFIAKTIHLLPW